MHTRSLLSRLFETAITVAVSVWLLAWAWAALRPLLPVLVVAAVLVAIAGIGVRRYRGW